MIPSLSLIVSSATRSSDLISVFVRPSRSSLTGVVAEVTFSKYPTSSRFASIWGSRLPLRCAGCIIRPNNDGFAISVPVTRNSAPLGFVKLLFRITRPNLVSLPSGPLLSSMPHIPYVSFLPNPHCPKPDYCPPPLTITTSLPIKAPITVPTVLPFPVILPGSGSGSAGAGFAPSPRSPSIAIAGSRSLSSSYSDLIDNVVKSIITSGAHISVGCCVGCDDVVIWSILNGPAGANVPLSSIRCFAAFDESGDGSCSLTARSTVFILSNAIPGSVSWLAGGPLSVPLRGRLAKRTKTVIDSASACVVFFDSADSVGTLGAARTALSRGLPVIAFACGLQANSLPSLGAGSWVSIKGDGVWSRSFQWVSSLLSLPF